MPNVFNYAEKWTSTLDQMITQNSLTSLLETKDVRFMEDGKTFHVPNLAVSGYKSHSRNGGFNRGEVTTTNEPYTLSFDRDIEFFVDKADVDETAQVASAANVTKIFMSENAVPEIDAYRFSKIATRAIAETQFTAEAITAANVYSRLKAAILPVRKYGPNNIIIYVSSETMDALERSTEFTRQITNQNVGQTALESRVTSLDGVQLIEVWDSERFYTGYDFTSGFVPAVGSFPINFLVVAKSAIIAAAKIRSIYLFQPGQHTQGDGYLYQNRMYHDLFVLKGQADGVYVSRGTVAVV
jgi:hypothetical protein